jgi:hypothetical protein
MRLLSTALRSNVEERLDEILLSRFATQPLQDRVMRCEELPCELQRCVTGLEPSCVWRAYTSVDGIFCAIARAPLNGPDRDLEVYFIDAQGWVYSAGIWTHDHQHGWWLNSIVTPSYDSEYGWWLGALMSPTTQAKNAVVESLPESPHSLPHRPRIARAR